MAFFCLTFLEGQAGGRAEAARRYRIGRRVLRKLGELTGSVGGPREARKMNRRGVNRPLSDLERRWIEAVVPALIRRVGEYDFDQHAPWREITMADLPSL